MAAVTSTGRFGRRRGRCLVTALGVVAEYFSAWNRHEASGIAAMFAEDGAYSDPNTVRPLTSAAIGEYHT